MLQEAERVQPQLFRQPRHQGQPLCSSTRQHHRKDGAASVEARKTVLSHVCRCCPPLPQLDCRPRLGVWCHPHGSRQLCKLAVGSKRSCELLDDVVRRPHPCDGCGWRGIITAVVVLRIIGNHIPCKLAPRAPFGSHVAGVVVGCRLDDDCSQRTAPTKCLRAYGCGGG